ncbi:FG-GAP repeat domain-containing protein [Frateuria hangzhouensis]|uniref:FG-GAP repeat domain-containing protein n=1 Tax=Frateuria hangzhouensis TaxID=2995589 RepID=UPI002260B51C|nr:VCBS repeat-containing protein [Frateuria sp. STR12]MCX7514562.1 VCBS repeat-containing protein [Frateuria sp. STR12]
MSNNKASRRLRVLACIVAVMFSDAAICASPHYSLVGSMPAWGSGGLANPLDIAYTDGYIYGMASGDYFEQAGVFSMSLQGDFTKLHEFDWGDGMPYDDFFYEAYSDLVRLKDGSLFGTTTASAFTVSGSEGFKRVHTYPDMGTYGSWTSPHNLVVDRDGNVFGIANAPSGPTLVAIDPQGDTRVIYDFRNDVGDWPVEHLVAGLSGEFYVTVLRQEGEVILKIKDGVCTVLRVLSDDYEGGQLSALVIDGGGNLVGSTLSGGPGFGYHYGTLFRLAADGTSSIIHEFDGLVIKNGDQPSDLLIGADGSIYGINDLNGSDVRYGTGVIFRVAPNGRYSVLHTMEPDPDRSTAAPVLTNLIQGAPRTIYGISLYSGPNGTGAIFKLVVPIQDDVTGKGVSSLIFTGPGILSIGSASGTATDLAITAGYYPAAVADFNGDGIADILWTSPRHDLYVWSGGPNGFTSKFAGTYPAGWTVAGAGDFDADGRDDLAWVHKSTHQFAYWLMNGATRTGYKVIRYTAGYYPVTVGDFDADGRADVLWSSDRHDLYTWISRGQGFVSKFVANFPATWKIVGRGDLDGDGSADLVWMTDDDAEWGYWLMNGGAARAIKSFGVPAAVSGSRVATVADYDGDGVADVLWSDGHALTLWENRGGCLDVPGCAFSQSVPSMTLSTGQSVFNSGLPATR